MPLLQSIATLKIGVIVGLCYTAGNLVPDHSLNNVESRCPCHLAMSIFFPGTQPGDDAVPEIVHPPRLQIDRFQFFMHFGFLHPSNFALCALREHDAHLALWYAG